MESCVGKSKEILAIFKDRRRLIKFIECTDPANEYRNLKDAVQATFSDLLDPESEGQGSAFYLQTDTKQWGVVDVSTENLVPNLGTIFIKQETAEEVI